MAAADENDLSQHVEIIRSRTDASEINAAVLAIEPFVRRTALRVAHRRCRTLRQVTNDFVDDALAAMLAPRKARDGAPRPPRVAEYRDLDGPFSGWLWTALDHLLIDKLRAVTRQSKHESAAFAARSPDRLGGNLFRTIRGEQESFSTRDLKLIGSWPVLDRIRLLSIGQLWSKVPADFWKDWCEQEGIEMPFPPPRGDDEPFEHWLAVLASETQQTAAALKQHWHRKRKLLADLDYVRELRDEG